MKADPFAQLRLLELQALDTAHSQLAHRRRTLPELAEIDRLEALVTSSRDEVTRLETEASDLARQTGKLEDEIAQVRARKQRNDDRLASGSIAAKQMTDLEHENVSLVRRQGNLEDQELELLEQAETVQGELDALLEERAGRRREQEQAGVARDARFAEIDTDVEAQAGERATMVSELPEDLVALYEKIRASEGGVGAGEVARGRCGACRLELMSNEKAELRAAKPDDVTRHEECRRILVRTAESGL